MKNWETLSRKVVLDMPPYLRVEQHNIQLPEGTILEGWPWLISPDFVNIAVITKEKEYLLFRQTKYSVKGTSLAPVGDTLNREKNRWLRPNVNCWRRQVTSPSVGKTWATLQ